MFEVYVDGYRALRAYPEFVSLVTLVRYALLALIGLLIILTLLHGAYLLGYNSPLYRRRSPRPGWSRRLLPILGLFFALVIGMYWGAGRLVA